MIERGLKRHDSRPEADSSSASSAGPSTPTAPRSASFSASGAAPARMTSIRSSRRIRRRRAAPRSDRPSGVQLPGTQLTPVETRFATTVSAPSSSSPANSRYHHTRCVRSCASSVGGRLARRPRRRRLGRCRRDDLLRIQRRQVRLGRIDVARHDDRRRRRRAPARGSRRSPARSARARPARRRRARRACPTASARPRDDVARPAPAPAVRIEHLPTVSHGARLAIRAEVAHDAVHERQEDRLERRSFHVVSSVDAHISTRPRPTRRSSSAGAPSSNRASDLRVLGRRSTLR